MTKQNKLMTLVKKRVKITLKDSKIIVGRLLAYDKHMNVVIEEGEEFRKTLKATERRNIGLIMLTGRNIISIVLESSLMEMDVDEGITTVEPPRNRIPASEILMPHTSKLPMPGQKTLQPTFRP